MKNPDWTRDELILALELYRSLDHGQMDGKNPEVIRLSKELQTLGIHDSVPDIATFRSVNSVSLKLANMKRLDSSFSGVGMKGGSEAEKAVWNEFLNDRLMLINEATRIRQRYNPTNQREAQTSKTKRSFEFWLVAYFLSKFGDTRNNQKAAPPVELEVDSWKDAYRLFYDSLNEGRDVEQFEHSLKNARDEFDAHVATSTRIGWRDENGQPDKLNRVANGVLQVFDLKSRIEIWDKVQMLIDRSLLNYETEFKDLTAIQESLQEDLTKTKTEGGKKVFISYKYERDASLRGEAFKHHGYECAVCGFDYGKAYGEWGKGFAEVHHVIPLADSKGQLKQTNPKEDLIVLCANCHRMVHRKKGITLTVDELKQKLLPKMS